MLRQGSVVKRQLWLLNNVPNITLARAYDQARKEFYDLRLQQDVERRVVQEEALATGAYFGKTALKIGMELEDQEFERWKEWASKETVLAEQKRAAMYTGGDSESTEELSEDEVEGLPDAENLESQGNVPI